MPARDPPASTPPPHESSRAAAPITIDRYFPLVYDELRTVAHRQLRDESTGHTLDTTALVHEVYLRLAGNPGTPLDDRRHFLALASRAMRRVLVDSARRYRAARRGGGQVPLALEESVIAADSRADRMLELDEALSQLAAVEPRLAQVVEHRFFAGLTEEEAADLLGVTARTVRRDWTRARNWLSRALGE